MPLHPGTNTLMRDIREVPFEHGLWPFVQVKFEINDGRFYSPRGVPEKIDDLDLEITKRHRNKLNNMDMMVPTFTYRFGSELNPDTFHFMPGEMYPVVNHDDLQALQVPDRTLADEREENILLTWNERYLGGVDINLAAQGTLSEARTAREITAIQQSAALTLGYRGQVLQFGMRQIYRMLWDLWQQWGPEEVWIKVTGEEMVRVTKSEILGDFDIEPVGTVESIDPQVESQRALNRLTVITQLVQQFGPDPLGEEHRLDVPAAILDWLRKDDIAASELIAVPRTTQEVTALREQQATEAELARRLDQNQPISIGEARRVVERGARTGAFPRGTEQRIQVPTQVQVPNAAPTRS